MRKNIYISGATGLAGSNIARVLSRYYNIFSERFDLRLTPNNIIKYLKDNKIDVFIHCAGLVGGIRGNVEGGDRYYIENKDMGIHAVDAALEAGVPYFINLSSSCAYPTNRTHPLTEDDYFANPVKDIFEESNKHYAKAKQEVSRYVYRKYTDQGITLIPCNLYGSNDNYKFGSHVIPELIWRFYYAKLLHRSEVTLYGNGRQERQFMDACDLGYTIAKLLDKVFSSEAKRFPVALLNVCTPETHNIMQVATTIARLYDWKGTIKWSGEFSGIQSKPMSRKLLIAHRLEIPYMPLDVGVSSQISEFISNSYRRKD